MSLVASGTLSKHNNGLKEWVFKTFIFTEENVRDLSLKKLLNFKMTILRPHHFFEKKKCMALKNKLS